MKFRLIVSMIFGVIGLILYIINFFEKDPNILGFAIGSTVLQLIVLLFHKIQEEHDAEAIKERDSKIDYDKPNEPL